MSKEIREKLKKPVVVLNTEFAATDVVFKKACELASADLEEKTGGKVRDRIKPTQRQASKYRNKKGSAFLFKVEASAHLASEKE